MLGAILKATNSSFQKGMIFGRSTYVKKFMKLLAYIIEQPSYACSANDRSHFHTVKHLYFAGIFLRRYWR